MAKKHKKLQHSQKAAKYADNEKDASGILSVFGHPCPVVTSCCFCIPLKTGSYIIAGLGILPTIASIILALPFGQSILHENGLPNWYSPGIDWMYGFLGAFVFSIHMILWVAIVLHKRQLIVFYLWCLLAYMGGSFGIALLISGEIMRQGHVTFGMAYISLAVLYTSILLYFWIVINSELYIEKKNSNVINIHITIV